MYRVDRWGCLRTICICLLVLAAVAASSAALAQVPYTYTFNGDFDKGTFVNVHHDIPDQLQLSSKVTLYPYINVAASARGTVVRIDVNTGKVVGEYRTAPRGRGADPSRTTVDFEGNVWVGNRAETSLMGSVTKIGIVIGGTRCSAAGVPDPNGRYLKPPFTHCTAVDRDGDGLIKTSFGLLDTLSWMNPGGIDNNGGVSSAEDECIIIYKRVPPVAARHLSIDRANNIWVGSIFNTMFYQMTPDGEIIGNMPNTCAGYGGLVDRNNVLWSTRGGGGLQRAGIDDTSRMCLMNYSYGITQDARGNIWVSDYSGGKIAKYQADGTMFPGFPKNCSCASASGVAVTPADGHVWVACRGSNMVKRLDTSGNVIGAIPVGGTPTGVAVDMNGKVWSTNLGGNSVSRIDPGGPGVGTVDLTVPLGNGAGPYNYSDMTGRVANMFNPDKGSWTVVHDSRLPGVRWGRLTWTDSIPPGTSIAVDVRAADDMQAIHRQGYMRVKKGVLFCSIIGRYLEVRAFFTRGSDPNVTPVLFDLTVDTASPPAADLIAPRRRNVPCSTYPFTLTETSNYGPRRWSTGETSRSIVVQNPGTYTVTVWWNQYCPITDSITLGSGSLPYLSLLRSGPTPPCAYDSVLLRADHREGTVVWNTGHAGDSIVVRRAGMYSVHLIDSLGCENDDSIRVDFAPLPVPRITTSGPSELCEGDSVVLTVVPTFASRQWSTGDTTASIVVRKAGTYRIAITDSNGCHADTAIAVTVQPLPKPAIIGAASACTGSTVQYAVTGLPGRSWTWQVDSGGVIVSGQGTSVLRVRWSVPGNWRITVTETSTVTGCRSTAVVDVTVAAGLNPVIAALPGTVLCEGDSVVLDAGEYASYAWSNGAKTRRITVRDSGAYFVRVTDSAGCAGISDTIHLTYATRVLPRIAGAATACAGVPVIYRATPPGASRYAWFPESGTVIAAGSDTAAIMWNTAGSFRIIVEMSDGSCTGRDTLLVEVRTAAAPLVTAMPSTIICQGDSVILTAGADYDRYLWSTGESSRRIVVMTSGTFTVRVADSIGCVAVSAPVTVTVHAAPRPAITGSSAICMGDSALLETSVWAAYQWITPAGNITGTRQIVAREAGAYTVEVTDSNGCTGRSLPFLLTVHALPQALVVGPSAFCQGDSIVLDAGPGMAAYRWTLPGGDSAATRSIIVTRGGTYMVAVTDSAGCTAASPPFAVTEHPRPPAPVVSSRCMELRSSPAASWQWLRNGIDIPGATDSLYLAVDTGSYRVRITDANGCSALSDEYHISVPISATATVRLPLREAAPGEHVSVPIGLAGVSDPALCGTRGFRAVIRLDASILLPSGGTDPGVLDGRDRLITIAKPWTPPGDPLAVLEFTAALGSVDRTPLHVESFAWDSPLVTATLIDGEFLLRVCREGGTRLFDDSGRFALHPNSPNPFNAQTTIAFELIEAAPTRLVVTDALGRVAAVLFDAVAEPGTRRLLFDASALPSGVYHLLLSTPSGLRSRSMLVVK